jgi:hypothetical protein
MRGVCLRAVGHFANGNQIESLFSLRQETIDPPPQDTEQKLGIIRRHTKHTGPPEWSQTLRAASCMVPDSAHWPLHEAGVSTLAHEARVSTQVPRYGARLRTLASSLP